MGAGVSNDLARTEGNDSFHLPARYAPSRVQAVYRGRDLPVAAGGLQIGTVGFRRDGLRSTTFRAHRWKLTIEMSALDVLLPSEVRAESFTATHGGDRVKVLDAKLVDWPAAPLPVPPPAPFAVQVKLDKPFVLGKGLNLCVDFLSETESSQPENLYWYVDAEAFTTATGEGSTRLLGRGCPFEFQTRAAVPPLDGESRIHTWSYTRWPGPGPTWAFLLLGTSNTSYGPLPLPFDLPGAPGCRLYTDIVYVLPGRTVANDARGTVDFFSGRLPADAQLTGLVFYEQVLVSDPGSNVLGIRSSSYLEVQLGSVTPPLPARLVYHSGPSLSDVPVGAVDAGIVLQLQP
jgi:hypothetical protein